MYLFPFLYFLPSYIYIYIYVNLFYTRVLRWIPCWWKIQNGNHRFRKISRAVSNTLSLGKVRTNWNGFPGSRSYLYTTNELKVYPPRLHNLLQQRQTCKLALPPHFKAFTLCTVLLGFHPSHSWLLSHVSGSKCDKGLKPFYINRTQKLLPVFQVTITD